jgi:uncharacterized protein involved in response to NO
MLFFAGGVAVLLSMAWWTGVLVFQAAGSAVAIAAAPPGWLHAALTQYGMLPPFIFGFLLTVFPRWLGQPALPRRRYAGVFGGVLGGYLIAHAGVLLSPVLLRAGFVLMLGGWLLGLYSLLQVLRRHGRWDLHAVSCAAALCVGAAGLAAFTGYLCGLLPAAVAWLGLRCATWLFLLPMYFTVCHRMIPFFSAAIVGPGYRDFRPAWSLPLVWLLLCAHLLLDAAGQPAWLWLPDAALAVLFALHALRWQPWRCTRPGLLLVLHIAFAWLPLALALYALQSASLALTGAEHWGRGPLHALTIGYFGSMLVAMVTRVSQGHSGRPLQMSATAWFAFGLVQAVALLRIAAEQLAQAPLWMALAAAGWLLAFLPWVLHCAAIYWRPRADGKPG